MGVGPVGICCREGVRLRGSEGARGCVAAVAEYVAAEIGRGALRSSVSGVRA